MQKAYITGATGCVGRNLVDTLLKEGWEVTCLYRKESDVSKLSGCNVRLSETDLSDVDSIRRSMSHDADAVFHVAANVSHNPDAIRRQYEDNVTATGNLVEASAGRVGRFVLTSTGAARRAEARNERSGYMTTKLASEKAALQFENTVIIRPAIVVGKYDYNNYSRIFRLIKSGELRRPLPGKLVFCNASSVAEAHLAAFHCGSHRAVYHLGGEWREWREFWEIACELMGVEPLRRPIPRWLCYAISHAMLAKQRLVGGEATLTPELVDLMCRNSTEDLPDGVFEAAKTELGYRSPGLEQSMKECYQWLLKENRL